MMKSERVLNIESGRHAADDQALLKTYNHGNRTSARAVGIAPHGFH